MTPRAALRCPTRVERAPVAATTDAPPRVGVATGPFLALLDHVATTLLQRHCPRPVHSTSVSDAAASQQMTQRTQARAHSTAQAPGNLPAGVACLPLPTSPAPRGVGDFFEGGT